jgi:hypothetical protein
MNNPQPQPTTPAFKGSFQAGRIGTLLLVSLSIMITSASACVHYPKGFDHSKFLETSRSALLFHDTGDPSIANLILKSSYLGTLPKELAWVFPLPSKPLEFKEAPPDLFERLSRPFFKLIRERKLLPEPDPYQLKARTAITVHKPELVGNYEIIPIEISDPTNGGKDLNSWLTQQGFAPLEEEIQKPYLRKGAVFLAIKMKTNGTSMDLKPLWIRYKSDKLEFPLRFAHQDRTFHLNLFIAHSGDTELKGIPVTAEYDPVGVLNLPLEALAKDYPEVANYLNPKDHTRISRMYVTGVNEDFLTEKLTTDPGLKN